MDESVRLEKLLQAERLIADLKADAAAARPSALAQLSPIVAQAVSDLGSIENAVRRASAHWLALYSQRDIEARGPQFRLTTYELGIVRRLGGALLDVYALLGVELAACSSCDGTGRNPHGDVCEFCDGKRVAHPSAEDRGTE